jgi:glycine cleavage system aminomethyltransferase T
MGMVESQHARLGSKVEMEITVEYSRHVASATIVKTPFFDPERKRV